jgi:hypothetical protein
MASNEKTDEGLQAKAATPHVIYSNEKVVVDGALAEESPQKGTAHMGAERGISATDQYVFLLSFSSGFPLICASDMATPSSISTQLPRSGFG